MNSYILDESNTPVLCDDVLKWSAWMEAQREATDFGKCRVAKTVVGDLTVFTSFLGIDHSFGINDTPILFETMIRRGKDHFLSYQWRYTTWDEAYSHHQEIVNSLHHGQLPDGASIRVEF